MSTSSSGSKENARGIRQIATTSRQLRLVSRPLRAVREPGIIGDVENVDRRVLVPPDYVLAHVGLDLAAIGAVGALEARQKTTLVLQMPRQVALPIEGLAAVVIGTGVGPALSSANFFTRARSTR